MLDEHIPKPGSFQANDMYEGVTALQLAMRFDNDELVWLFMGTFLPSKYQRSVGDELDDFYPVTSDIRELVGEWCKDLQDDFMFLHDDEITDGAVFEIQKQKFSTSKSK